MTEEDLRRWRETVRAKAVARRPERPRLVRSGGQPVADLYTELDLGDTARIGLPGAYPYTRGVQPTMYRASFWTMRQYAGFGTAAESNARYRYLLSQGTSGLSVAFDLPTQMGFDSDHPMALGEVGRVGVAIDSLADMHTLLDGIPLDEVSTSMTINATAATLLALYVAVARAQGVDPARLRGTVQNDVLKEYIARGTYIYPPRPSMRIVTDMFRWCAEHAPRWNTISISGYHIREAGSTAAQELAFTLADGIAYVQAAVDAGLEVDAFAPRLSFFFNAHNHLLEEVAKFRAARRLWARIVTERFDATTPKAKQLRFHTQTAGSSLTAQQVDNNVVRVAYQALAAVLGGTQSLHTNSKDEALALPTEESVRTALRTQQILAHESGVADTVDPLAGSYYVERLTDELEAEATAILDETDARGGMLAAVESQWVQRQIQEVAFERQREIEDSDRVIVGVNEFRADEASGGDASTIELQEITEADQQRQLDSLAAVKGNRDDEAVEAALAAVREAAEGTDNVMPPIVDAVKAEATVGEICDVLRDVFGEYHPGSPL